MTLSEHLKAIESAGIQQCEIAINNAICYELTPCQAWQTEIATRSLHFTFVEAGHWFADLVVEIEPDGKHITTQNAAGVKSLRGVAAGRKLTRFKSETQRRVWLAAKARLKQIGLVHPADGRNYWA